MSWLRRAAPHPFDDLAKATPDPVLVHGDPIESPEAPGRRIQDVGTGPDLEPQTDQGLLNGVLGRPVIEPGPPSEAQQILTAAQVGELDDLVGDSDACRVDWLRRIGGDANRAAATLVIHQERFDHGHQRS